MATPVIIPIGFEDSRAYAQINALASHAQRSFGNIRGNPFAAMNAGANTFNRTLDSTNDRFVAFAATASILYGVTNAFKGLFASAVSVEKALAEIQVNVKATNSELQSLSSGLFDVASETGQSFFTAAAAAAEFGRQGLKLNQILDATHAALVLTQTTGLDSVNAVQSLTAAVNTFTKEGITYSDVVNKMAAADTSFAVSSKDLAEGVRRVGSTAIDANIKYEELLATITALQQKTSRGGGVIGNSLKTIFTRLQREDTSAALEGLGVQTKTQDGEFRNQLAVLSDLAKAYDKLSASQRASVSEMVGGVYQINIIKALFQDLSRESSVYSQALGVVQKAQNDAFVKSEFLSGTAASKITALKNEFVELGGQIGNLGLNSATKGIAGELASMLDTVNDTLSKDENLASTGEKIGQSFVKGIVASITGPGLAIFARSMAQFSARVLGGVAGDIRNQISKSGVSKTQTTASNIIAENRLKAASLEAENQIYKAILQGNVALADRRRLIAQIVASQQGMGGLGAGFGGAIAPPVIRSRRRTFAGGYDPLQTEITQIAAGIGGASKNARPISKTINTSPGKREKVIVNSDEYIIGNYLGSGADAVFNKDMIRKAGGVSKLKELGNAKRAFASGHIGNFASGNLPFKQRGVRDLVALLQSNNALQRKGAENELRKRGYFNKASSVSLGIPVSMLSEKALISGPRKGLIGDKITQELSKRGTLNDPTLVKRGYPLSVLSQSALGKVAKDTKFTQFPAAVVQGAQKMRNDQLQKAQAARQASVAQRAARDAAMAQAAADAKKAAARQKEDRNQKAIALRASRKNEVQQKSIAAKSAFYDYVSRNPQADKKQLFAAAKQIRGEVGARVGRDDLKFANKQTRTNRNQAFAGKTIPFALGGAFAGSMIGDSIGGNGGKFVGSAINNAATLGSLGASFGPAGAAIGAMAGVFLSVTDAAKKSTVPLEKFQKIVGELGATTEKQQNAISKFFTSKDNLKGLLADPEASLGQIKSNVRDRALALADLPADIRKKITSASSDEDQAEIANDFMQKQVSKTNATTALASLASTADKANSATGLFFRKIFNNGKDDSRLKFGNLENPETTGNIKSAIQSLVSNIDLKELKSIAADRKNPKQDKADRALDALADGDFPQLVRSLTGLGVASDELLESFSNNLLPNIMGKELTVFNQATREANTALEEMTQNLERENRQRKLDKGAVMDMQRYIQSATARETAKNSIDKIGSQATKSRLGMLAQDPKLTSDFKNILDTARDLTDIGQGERQLNRDSSVAVRELAKKITLEASKGQIDKTLGTGFLNDLFTAADDENNIGKVIDKLNGGVAQLSSISQESLTELQNLTLEDKAQRAELQQQRQTLLEQLKVMQSIDKKTKFDDLISQYRQNSPATRAMDEMQFQMLKTEAFNPTTEQKKKRESDLANARRSSSSDALRNIISGDANLAKDLLTENDKKKARGEVGLSNEQIAKLQRDIVKDQVVNSFGLQSDAIQSSSKARGLGTSQFTSGKLEEAERLLSKGGGSIESVRQVIDLLNKSAGQITNPENGDRRDMIGLAQSLADQIKAQIGGTNLFADIDSKITSALGNMRSDSNPEGTTPEDAARLKAIRDELSNGRIPEALGKMGMAGNNVQLFDEIRTALQNIKPEDIQKAINSQVNNPDKGLDVASVLRGDLIPSQNKLNASLLSLQESVNNLTAIMSAEARIAVAAAGGAALNKQLDDKELQLNNLTAQRKEMMKINDGDRKVMQENLPVFLNQNNEALNKSKESRFRGSISNDERNEAYTFLNKVGSGQYTNPDEEAKGFELLEKIRNKTRVGVSSKDADRQSYIQSYRKSEANNETKAAEALEKQMAVLKTTIEELAKQIEKNNEETTKLREEATEVGKTKVETPASGGNLGVTVTGLDGTALAALKDQIAALISANVKELMSLANTNPKLFETLV